MEMHHRLNPSVNRALVAHPFMKHNSSSNNPAVVKEILPHRAIKHPLHVVSNPSVSLPAVSRHVLKL